MKENFRRFGVVIFACLTALPIAAQADVFNMPSGQTSLQTVFVGDAGNGNDPSDGDASTPGIQHFGAVDYNYRIGKYEVTVGQYTEFLNTVADTDTYGLYNTAMGTDVHASRISRSGVSGSFTYTAIDSPNQPVTFVSWGDAARFCQLAAQRPADWFSSSGHDRNRQLHAQWILRAEHGAAERRCHLVYSD